MVDVSELLRSGLDLVFVSVQLTFILTIGVVAALFLFNFFQKKFQWKWAGSTLLTGVVFFGAIFFLIHVSNMVAGLSASDTSLIPPDIRQDPAFAAGQPNVIILLASSLVQSLISGIIFSILLLPFAFGGVALFDTLKNRMVGVWPRVIVVCFLSSLAAVILLGAFPWILVSLIYLAFFGF